MVSIILGVALVLSLVGNFILWRATYLMYNKGRIDAYSEVLGEINNTIQNQPTFPPPDFNAQS